MWNGVSLPLAEIQRPVVVKQPLLHPLHRRDVAVAHRERHLGERDARRFEAILDDLLVEAGIVFDPRDPLLADGGHELSVPQQARGDVVVVCVEP